jgi:hypothetical protein
MSQSEINAKKIETLTKVVRLLGDQLQMQSRAINQLQNEVDWIKESLRTKIPELTQVHDQSKIQAPEVEALKATTDQSESKSESSPKKKPSDKEELRQALKIIDDL